MDALQAGYQIFLYPALIHALFWKACPASFFKVFLIQFQHIAHSIIHNMHGPAVYIQNNLITVIFIRMNLMIQR